MRAALVVAALALLPPAASAQVFTQRGFVHGSALFFPQEAPNDPTRSVGDLLVREEAFVKPAPWIQFAGGVDVRANSHEQVDDRWRLDFSDRGARRPRLSIRRLTAAATRGPFTIDVGKQFIRWGKTDIVNPTDRFAPRDFINVVDSEFLAVTAIRGTLQLGDETLEAVWVPRFTPSRLPLVKERWTVVPPDAAGIPLVDSAAPLPPGSQVGLRWGHLGGGFEYAISFFDGFNYFPDIRPTFRVAPLQIEIARSYPSIRTYGVDAAAPTRWFTVKGEAAFFSSPPPATDEYVLYVVQLERHTGEWVLVGGYAGEVVTERRSGLTFAPDRGTSRAFVARASYTVDPNRSVAVEGAARQDGDGAYAKAEYSQASGQHWRTTVMAVAIGGRRNDFLGQYRRNSHVALTLRYSF